MGQISSDIFFNWAGYLGVALYIGSYVALQLGWVAGFGYRYATLNLAAAAFVLISLYNSFNLASALIQISWILISIVGIVRTYLITRRLFFTEDEEYVLHHGLPATPRHVARRIFDGGNWIDADIGVTLTTEGAPVQELYFIVSGAADVEVDDKTVARVDGGFIGEMNVMEEGPASATVRVSSPARLFCISGASLRQMSKSSGEIKLNIERHLAAATKSKLLAANMNMSRS